MSITTNPRHLALIVPTYRGHIEEWTRFMTSIAASLSAGEGGDCGFDKFTVFSIVSTENEKALFTSALNRVSSAGGMACMNGCKKITEVVQIETLSHVLRGTSINSESVLGYTNKFLIQSVKKMYGCLAAHSINSAERAAGSQGNLCFAADSESYLLGNSSICQIATAYMEHRVIFTSPRAAANSDHQAMVKSSRGLLHYLDQDHFGDFYAMENYHWFWEPRIVWDFVNATQFESVAKNQSEKGVAGLTKFSRRRINIEEAFNHYLFSRREELGYSFVDVHAEIAKLIGSDKLLAMKHTHPMNEPVETICGHLGPLEESEIHQIGDMLSGHGVLLIRCDFAVRKKCELLQQHLGMCVSGHPKRPPRSPKPPLPAPSKEQPRGRDTMVNGQKKDGHGHLRMKVAR